MQSIFITVFNMSIVSIWFILVVFILRLVLKKLPRWIICILWSCVGIRLICPWNLESTFSMIPSAEPVSYNITISETPRINSGLPYLNNFLNPIIMESLSPNSTNGVYYIDILMYTVSIIWIAGVFAMVIYFLISYVKTTNKVRESVAFGDNILFCDRISSPFVFGIINPKIYIPSDIEANNLEYVFAHEKAHIKRRDNIWKILGFIVLTINWFNPLVWLAYVIFSRDIEIACDEKVIKEHGEEFKKPYLHALIMCSCKTKNNFVISTAFGKSSLKNRISNILDYKKPRVVVMIMGIVLCIVTAACFMTNPIENDNIYAINSGYYSYKTINDSSFISLDMINKTFVFSPSGISSLLYRGTYVEDSNSLTLNVDNIEGENLSLVFEKNGDNLIFDDEKSEIDIPKYKYSPNSEPRKSIPNGAVFKKTFMSEYDKNDDEFFGIYGTAYADLDGNGIEETWGLGVGPTSGVCSVSLTAKENDAIKYETYFATESKNEFSLKTERNKLFVVIKNADENFKEYSYEISLNNGQIQILSD